MPGDVWFKYKDKAGHTSYSDSAPATGTKVEYMDAATGAIVDNGVIGQLSTKQKAAKAERDQKAAAARAKAKLDALDSADKAQDDVAAKGKALENARTTLNNDRMRLHDEIQSANEKLRGVNAHLNHQSL